MAYKNPGSVRRHLGGKQAARTRMMNDHYRQFGYPTYDDREAEQKRITRPIHKSSRAIQPAPIIINGKQVCPVCQEHVNIWGFGAHYNMTHIAKNSTGGTVNDTSTANKPAKVIRANEPAPTIPTNNNNTTTQPAPHKRDVRFPKFEAGEQVMLNGFKECKIRTTSLKREILDIKSMTFEYFYKLANGTNSKGNSYHWYPESRLTMIVPVGAQHDAPHHITTLAQPHDKPKILAFPFPNVRTRRYNIHSRLQFTAIRRRTNVRPNIFNRSSATI